MIFIQFTLSNGEALMVNTHDIASFRELKTGCMLTVRGHPGVAITETFKQVRERLQAAEPKVKENE